MVFYEELIKAILGTQAVQRTFILSHVKSRVYIE